MSTLIDQLNGLEESNPKQMHEQITKSKTGHSIRIKVMAPYDRRKSSCVSVDESAFRFCAPIRKCSFLGSV